MIGTRPVCDDCKHFDYSRPGARCKAFPDGIPAKILRGSERHKTTIDGQTGDFVYTPE